MTAREMLTEAASRIKPAEAAAERAGLGSVEELLAANWRSAAKALAFIVAEEERPPKVRSV